MAGTGSVSNDYSTKRSSERSLDMSSGKKSPSGEALTEWRLSKHMDNGTPSSSSPPYWDTDEEENDSPKPSMLYGRHTWKIENFSKTSKRELKSEIFDVGGYKWYILIYPQGCDVCNHLSLFLCVANHDKLRPGWSHFAQFTIAVVNTDPKKSKYSDTLHRFWKKEHDWGWKKFMEQSKVQDGFIAADSLEIRAQVQIIREKTNRPFRCLDRHYRRELLRIYVGNVETTCFNLIKERRKKLRELIDDKVRWLSFCTFWIGIDQSTKYSMSREKSDVIMRVAVKHLFVEKEVSSTLVMETLNCGLKALEAESNGKQGKSHLSESGETATYISVEDDMFALTDDVLLLIERVSLEPLKEDVCHETVKKEGNCGDDLTKDSSEKLERRLTYLGRKTVEIFVFAHIFSKKIDAAYREEVAFKRQEELIREEEETGLAELELKEKRRIAIKEKRSKRKMVKQNRSKRKGKDRCKNEKFNLAGEAELQSSLIEERNEETNSVELAQSIPVKAIDFDAVSDVTDIDDDVCEPVILEVEGQHTSCVFWNADTSGPSSKEFCDRSSLPFGNGNAVGSSPSIDESSSTCSADSIPSVIINRILKKNSYVNYKPQNSSSREKNQRPSELHEKMAQSKNTVCHSAMIARNRDAAFKRTKSDEPVWKAVSPSKGQIQKFEPQITKKGAPVSSHHTAKERVRNKPSKHIPTATLSSTGATHRNSIPIVQSKTLPNGNLTSVSVKEESHSKIFQTDVEVTQKMHPPQTAATFRSVVKKDISSRHVGMPVENPTSEVQYVRPTNCSNAHDTTGVSAVPVISMFQTNPIVFKVDDTPMILTAEAAPLSHPSNTSGREDTDSSPAILSSDSAIHSSYRGTDSANNLSGYMPSAFNPSSSLPSPPLDSSASALARSVQNTTGTNHDLGLPGFTFGSVTPEVLHNQLVIKTSQGSSNASSASAPVAIVNRPSNIVSFQVADGFATSALSRQAQSSSMSEFPHLDIIDFLFDDELGDNDRANGRSISAESGTNFHNDLGQQFVFRNDMSTLIGMGSTTNGHFEHPMFYYGDEAQAVYGDFTDYTNVGMPFDFSMYEGWQSDGMFQNQLPIGYSPNVCLVGDGYPMHVPEYLNLACGVDAYGSFQPSSG